MPLAFPNEEDSPEDGGPEDGGPEDGMERKSSDALA